MIIIGLVMFPSFKAGEMEDMVTDSRDDPQTDFIYCFGANTEVLKFGSCQLHSGHKILFLIIPGNPGVVGFYRTFMQTLHRMFGYRHPVWAVSHAGHCVPPDSMDMVEDASLAAEGDVFGLNGQIEHKLAFLRKYVPRETRPHPDWALHWLLHYSGDDQERSRTQANAMYMGGQEMKKVLERDNITIRKNLEKLIFYYGATDHWCPIQYYLDIKKDFPHGDIRLCENGFRHAFVLDTGREVAKMVVEWISGDLTTQVL
uniref:Lipid droplet-associated hydrolase n=1 Tax=Lates calcarifer TaxID=8187 RepID=A0A4W6BPR2_LATCA